MAVDRASEQDRAWFLEHPAESVYVRPYIPGELGDLEVGPAGAYNVTIVRQLELGVRTREPLQMRLPTGPMNVLLWRDGESYPVDPLTGAVRGLPDDERTTQIRQLMREQER